MRIKKLKYGDVIKHKSNSDTYLVTGIYGDRVTATKTVDITNEDEWEKVLDVNYNKYNNLL